MRHAFDVRSGASFPTVLDPSASARPLQRRGGATLPPMTSATLQPLGGPAEEVECPLSLAKLLPQARFFNGEDLPVTGIVSRVEECEAGDVVVHRIGGVDPQATIAEALARGAAGILTEQLLPCPLPQCIVADADHALARIAAARHRQPDRNLLTVGVLGNSGKTSTCLLAATLTRAFGVRTAYWCDLGCSDGVVQETPARSVPAGADLIDWMAESGDCCSRVAVVEIDEHAARRGRYDSVSFDVLIVAGRSARGDDFGPSGLQCLLDRLTDTGVVIAPGGDQRTVRQLQGADCHFVTYGTAADCDFLASPIEQAGGITTLMLSAGDTSVMMETSLCGRGMAANLAACMAFGVLLGHPLHAIAEKLASLRAIPGRSQRLIDFGKATVVLEAGGAPDRLREALCTAKHAGVGGRVWCVLAVGDREGAETLARYGRTMERFAHHCVVTSRPDQDGSFLNRSHHVLDGVKECAAIRLVADQEKAIRWAIEQAGPRDSVVIVTNRPAQTPYEDRCVWQQLEGIVAAAREQREPAPTPSSPGPEPGRTINLKLFGG